DRELAEFARIRSELESAITKQREGTAKRAVARDPLVADIKSMARSARSIAVEIPGFDRRFPMPSSVGDPRLVDIATAFARDTAPHISLFDTHGTATAVVTGLTDRLKALDAALQQQRDGKADVTAAVAGINASTRRLRQIVDGLDAIAMSG